MISGLRIIHGAWTTGSGCAKDGGRPRRVRFVEELQLPVGAGFLRGWRTHDVIALCKA